MGRSTLFAVTASPRTAPCCFDSWDPSFYSAIVKVFTASSGTTASPSVSLAQVAKTVQGQLAEVEARIVQQASVFDPAVEGYVAYAIGGRGKRLRPLVALLSGGATGSIKSAHIDLAVILELIHIATLVHDDIMDEADRRRGQPTVNARWGNALSVLLGDCLFAQALNLSTNFDRAEISRSIAQAAREVCSGEIIQTQRRFDLHLAVEDYRRIVAMKTGSLFAAAAELGAVINEAEPATVRSLQTFGMKIGAAYQIYDDCLDIAGNETVIGKTLGTDLRKGKLTLPVLMLLQSAPAVEREQYCQMIVGGKVDEMTEILNTDVSTAPLSQSITAGQELIREAQRELHLLPPSNHTDSLTQLGEALRDLLDQLRE
ncbi:MAG: polyprenyl synthetase family protein [Chthoniobacterales bacterium]|nr:polyprenyl synthetase family protein [Chthoniobacterales bacterium]